ncbi:hypothetical protein [Allosphingosinicella indica]|uniref:Uncharacterized protein n=1 Tax=Allosphingosinicella indica TaxID=941907 RepID=A0A1X7G3R4_9SPHN|nr:hypothetical protein [Allosphingosinicella indica]SMF63519.1 hypothetical protein SAMN06295910_1091 [Allosphingosinicella indica]
MYHDRMLAARGVAGWADTRLVEAIPVDRAPMEPKQDANASSGFLAPLGEWFDEDYDFTGPEGDAFADALLAQVEAIEVRKRARRQADVDNHQTFLRKLAANGFRAFRSYHPPLVAVQLAPHAYRGRAGWLNGVAMKRELELLREAGLVEINIGVWGEASTTYSVTPDFMIAAIRARLTGRNITHRLEPHRLVRLYRTNSDDGDLIAFEPDDQTRRWTEQIDAYNRFVAAQDVAMDLSSRDKARLLAQMNAGRREGIPRLKQPDLTNKSLFRQFNEGSFEAGGRLYGAWWINCPKEFRPMIRINGKPTVELDFSGCAVRMLYHEKGMAFEGDPYFLEALDACEREHDLRKSHFREGVKRLTQALINGCEGGSPERIRLTKEEAVRPYFKQSHVLEMIRAKHEPIAQSFQTGAWRWLQRADSDIALSVIHNLMEKGIVALPIHDSFIVAEGDKEALRLQMTVSYLDQFDHEPVIN